MVAPLQPSDLLIFNLKINAVAELGIAFLPPVNTTIFEETSPLCIKVSDFFNNADGFLSEFLSSKPVFAINAGWVAPIRQFITDYVTTQIEWAGEEEDHVPTIYTLKFSINLDITEPVPRVGMGRLDSMEPLAQECSICFDPLAQDDAHGGVRIAVLNCTHKFHDHCIVQWLDDLVQDDHIRIPRCPICRQRYPTIVQQLNVYVPN